MLKIEKTTVVKAPAEHVFEFLADPKNLLQIWPNMMEVTELKSLPKGGYTFKFGYKMAGSHFSGHSECIEYKPTTLLVYKNTGIDSTITWKLQPEKGETRVFFASEYTIPGALIGKLVEPMINKLNEHDADALMANLKVRLETPIPAGAAR